MHCKVTASCHRLSPSPAPCPPPHPSPIRRSSSCLTSTASLTLRSGSIRFSQAAWTARAVISEKRARSTCRLGFTAEQTRAPGQVPRERRVSQFMKLRGSQFDWFS